MWPLVTTTVKVWLHLLTELSRPLEVEYISIFIVVKLRNPKSFYFTFIHHVFGFACMAGDEEALNMNNDRAASTTVIPPITTATTIEPESFDHSLNTVSKSQVDEDQHDELILLRSFSTFHRKTSKRMILKKLLSL